MRWPCTSKERFLNKLPLHLRLEMPVMLSRIYSVYHKSTVAVAEGSGGGQKSRADVMRQSRLHRPK